MANVFADLFSLNWFSLSRLSYSVNKALLIMLSKEWLLVIWNGNGGILLQ